nr:SAM-dependent methyltransferase [Spirochaetaceae bacterium]
EDLALLAQSRSTMVLFLSVDQALSVQEKLLPSYGGETPVAIVYRASWPDEKIVRGTLKDLAELVEKSGITRQALIFVGNVLDSNYEKSKLYDAAFTHGFREAIS